MKNKQKISRFKSNNVTTSFTGQELTLYAGLAPIMRFIRKMKLGIQLNKMFPNLVFNATKFSNIQILLSVILASLSGVNRLNRIANFTNDALVKSLLGLSKGLNKDVISSKLKQLGQAGAILLPEYFLNCSTN